MANKHELWELQSMQAAPLNVKISMTKQRIRDWVNEFGVDGVYVSFSGGKDSTVLLTIAREMYPDIKAVFIDTGLEFPEIREFVKTWDNVDWLKPKMNFKQVIEKYGYPFISKEVSEAVWGARKYLTSLIESGMLDRPTDRPTDRNLRTNGGLRNIVSYMDKASIAANSRGERQQIQKTARNRRVQYAFEWEKLTATGRYGKHSDLRARILGGGLQETSQNSADASARMAQEIRGFTKEQVMQAVLMNDQKHCGGVPRRGDLERLLASSRLKILLTQDYTKTIDNLRVQRLMGINRTDGKATTETIPSKTKDRSQFSCQRYQFFLDAPFEISNHCCNVMKKEPAKRYGKETGRVPITAMMASESRLRTQKWLKQGCNAFDAKKPMSMPMAFWTEQDVLLYIYQNKIPIASVYGEVIKENEVDGQIDMADLGLFDIGIPILKTTGWRRTGCVFCGFGAHRDGCPGRFERLKETHPHLYEYIMKPWEEGGLNYKEIIDWINEHGNLEIKY